MPGHLSTWFIPKEVKLELVKHYQMYGYSKLSEIKLNAFGLRNHKETYHMDICEESLSDLNESLEINPDDALALKIRGITYRKMSRYEESLADLNKLLEIEPDNAEILSERGETYRMMNRCKESLKNLNKSLKIKPNNASALRYRGATYRMMNRFKNH
ncbi:hypothetical protein C2G38_2034174 [Gigaspora rosea]|uniref:Uncharacterized protein n=1 Tax=Gigaspora rosea TaxID=44941 RepID=A0A397VP52_9GLOM|nr:hypothetical protein C2G38_2034174 [Gigaspora rosea]